MARGAYILSEAKSGAPDVILIGTGSEVALCMKAQERLLDLGIQARVVSMPSWNLFEAQDDALSRKCSPGGAEEEGHGGGGQLVWMASVVR